MIHLEFVSNLSVFQKGLKAIKKLVFLTQKIIKIKFLAVLLIKFFLLMIYLANLLFFIAVNMQIIISSKRFLKSFITVKKSRKAFSQKIYHD